MNALDLLTEQHEEVDSLIQRIEASEGDAKEVLFQELADKVAAHAKIEEKIFYPAVMAKQTEEMLLESVEEHLAVKRVLSDLIELDPNDDQFDAKLAVMKHQLEHHAHEEEEAMLFPKVKKIIDEDQLEALGGEMMALFDELLAQHPSRRVPEETGEAAPL